MDLGIGVTEKDKTVDCRWVIDSIWEFENEFKDWTEVGLRWYRCFTNYNTRGRCDKMWHRSIMEKVRKIQHPCTALLFQSTYNTLMDTPFCSNLLYDDSLYFVTKKFTDLQAVSIVTSNIITLGHTFLHTWDPLLGMSSIRLNLGRYNPLPRGLNFPSASAKVPIWKKDNANRKIILLTDQLVKLELKVKRLAYVKVEFKSVVSAWFRRLFIVALFSLRRD